jgi:hypothetical protein
MSKLTARELILAARPGVEIRPNRNSPEKSELPFELSYKGHQIAVGRHEDTVWRDALSCGVLGTECVPPIRIDVKPVVSHRREERGWGSLPLLHSLDDKESEWQIKPDAYVAICSEPCQRLKDRIFMSGFRG